MGLSTLALTVGEEPETVETVCEPFLLRQGFLARTPRGRVALPSAWQHLGLTPPVQSVGGAGGAVAGRGEDDAPLFREFGEGGRLA